MLAEAGVVDAGAHGLVVILAGIVAGLRDDSDALPELPHHEPARATRPHHFDSRFRYCTNFIVTGTGLDARSFVPRLEEIGDSVLVVGDEATLKVHVHTDEPEVAVAVFEEAGDVQRLDVADMREQIAAREARLRPAVAGAVAVASGDGMRTLFEGLGAHVVDGGPTLNPSTYEILAGIHEVPAEEVMVLPNSPNVILAAEEAAKLSEKPARVVPEPIAAGGARPRSSSWCPTRMPTTNAERIERGAGRDPLGRGGAGRAGRSAGAVRARRRAWASRARRSSRGAAPGRRCRRRSSASPRVPRS